MSAGGYILQVPKDRRKLLLDEAEHGGSFYRSKPYISEPVPRFDHSRRAPLAVFASFEDGFITHIADGRKGLSAGTGLVRLNLEDLQAPNAQAFVFITNMAIHRHLYERPVFAVSPIGFRVADFNRPGYYGFAEKYALDHKYKQLFDIADALGRIGSFPSTFDGSLPSDNMPGEPERLQIGQTYHFTDATSGGLIGTVQSAVVMESTKTAYIAVNTPDGQAHILSEQMSDVAFADYLEHKEAYFGAVQDSSRVSKTPYELFCRMMEIYAEYDRSQLARQLNIEPYDSRIAGMSEQQLREYVSEQIALQIASKNRSAPDVE